MHKKKKTPNRADKSTNIILKNTKTDRFVWAIGIWMDQWLNSNSESRWKNENDSWVVVAPVAFSRMWAHEVQTDFCKHLVAWLPHCLLCKKEIFGLLTLLDCITYKDPNQQWMFIKPPLSAYLFRCAIWRKTCLFFCTVCHQLNRSIFFFFFLRCEPFLRESRCCQKQRKTCLEAKKFSNSRRYTPVWPTATFWQIEATFFSNQMIFAAGALSFRRPCHRKKKKNRSENEDRQVRREPDWYIGTHQCTQGDH